MKYTLTIFTLLIFVLVGCNDSTYHGELATIDSLIVHQDKRVLTILDSLSKNQRNFTKKDYMLYRFLLADAHNQFFISMKADTFMTDVADYYNRYGNDKQRIKALYLLGCVYRDKGDAPTTRLWSKRIQRKQIVILSNSAEFTHRWRDCSTNNVLPRWN